MPPLLRAARQSASAPSGSSGRKPEPLQLALWTDRAGYRAGETVRLYRTLDPHDDDGRYRTFPGSAEQQAAYHFLHNGKVAGEDILQPHREALLERLRRESTVLLVQETTTLKASMQFSRHSLARTTAITDHIHQKAARGRNSNRLDGNRGGGVPS